MSKDEIIRKLTSRKFILAVGAFVTLVLVAVGYSDEQADKIVTIIVAGLTIVAYIFGEAKIDIARLGQEEGYVPVDAGDGEDDIETL